MPAVEIAESDENSAGGQTDRAASGGQEFEIDSAFGRYKVRGVFVDNDQPPTNQPFDIRIEVASKHGLQEALIVHFDSTMPEHGHGMLVDPPVLPQEYGAFLIRDVLLHMGGRWEMYFDISEGGVIERAQLEIWLQ